jgi:hypothetical protein
MRSRTLTLFGSLAFAMATACAPLGWAQAPIATIHVQTAPLNLRIPKDYVGMSLEVSVAGQGLNTNISAHNPRQIVYALGEPGSPNRDYFQFMRNLGAGVLRLGGNSQDNTCWDPAAAPHPERCKGTLTAANLQLWADAARATSWKLIVGLNLKQNSPDWALREVDEGVARILPRDRIIGLEIGNEPSLFPHDGSRAKGYDAYQQGLDARAYADRFARDPVARQYTIAGPAACCFRKASNDVGVWLDTVGPNRVALATVHNYFRTVCGNRTVTIGELLDPALAEREQKAFEQYAVQAGQRGVPIALAETNSASCGGMPGVSDAFASAAWGLDWMFSAASVGYRNMDFHSSYRTGGSSYVAVQVYGTKTGSRWKYENIAQPLYYAMYAFARHASGRALLPVQIQTAANIRAYAVTRCAGCALTVFIINKDSDASGQVQINLDPPQEPEIPAAAWGPATMLALSAPALNSKAGDVHYGGAQFDSHGHIFGVKWQPVTGTGIYMVDLPKAAIAILRVSVEKPQ